MPLHDKTPEELSDNELTDRREKRAWWLEVIKQVGQTLVMILAAVSGVIGAYYSIKNNTDIGKTDAKVEKAEVDRTRIEEKINTTASAAETAAEHAKVAVEEVKNVATETKTAVAEIKSTTMNTREIPTP